MTDKQTKLNKVVTDLEKRFGEGTIYRMGDKPMLIDRIHSGSLRLDTILGGGVPRGRVIEVYGPESVGKTTICQHIIAEAQKIGLTCAFIDMEHAFDPEYAKSTGVDLTELYFAQPDTGEQALEIADTLVKSGNFGVVVVDSVAALVPRAEIEGDMGDSHVALQARLMSQALRKLSGSIKQTNAIFIFTNQLRSRIGVTWGSGETTSGGNALKFYASIRLDLRRTGSNKEAGLSVSNNIKITCKKNKTAPPFKECEVVIRFGEGIDQIEETIDLAIENGLIQKGGAWFTYPDTTTGEIIHKAQGKPNMRDWLRENSAEYGALRTQVLLQLGLG